LHCRYVGRCRYFGRCRGRVTPASQCDFKTLQPQRALHIGQTLQRARSCRCRSTKMALSLFSFLPTFFADLQMGCGAQSILRHLSFYPLPPHRRPLHARSHGSKCIGVPSCCHRVGCCRGSQAHTGEFTPTSTANVWVQLERPFAISRLAFRAVTARLGYNAVESRLIGNWGLGHNLFLTAEHHRPTKGALRKNSVF